MKYYSIRVVKAPKRDRERAMSLVIEGAFEEEDKLCDAVLTKEELVYELSRRKE